MRVFISWSGTPAQYIAEALRGFLLTVLTGRVQPFMSSVDIERGTRFGTILSRELNSSDTGLIVLTSQNQEAPWLLFEAGALSKSLEAAYVTPLLVDLDSAHLGSPLAQFQRVPLRSREEFFVTVSQINDRLEHPVGGDALEILFNNEWPKLEAVVLAAVEELAKPKAEENEGSILAEIRDGIQGLQSQYRGLSNRVSEIERPLPRERSSSTQYSNAVPPAIHTAAAAYMEDAIGPVQTAIQRAYEDDLRRAKLAAVRRRMEKKSAAGSGESDSAE